MSSEQVTPSGGWRGRAACRDVDPEVFFPVAQAGSVHEQQVAAAKAVCAGCPVRSECLEEALARIPDGIAGGLTSAERHRVVRQGGRRAVTGDELVQTARTRAQLAAAGSVLLASGRSRQAVAQACGVSERTVYRWQAAMVPVLSATTNSTGTRCSVRSAGAAAGCSSARRRPWS